MKSIQMCVCGANDRRLDTAYNIYSVFDAKEIDGRESYMRQNCGILSQYEGRNAMVCIVQRMSRSI
jgi:hypothetical protein